MQSDFSESDPRLQRVERGPLVATGLVDPCVVYLETTLPGEIPLLVAFWASAAHEVKEVGGSSRLELKDVMVLKCHPVRTTRGILFNQGKTDWTFTTHTGPMVRLGHRGTTFFVPSSEGTALSEVNSGMNFEGSISFIDQKTNLSLQKLKENYRAENLLALKMLTCSKVRLPSVSDAVAALKKTEVQRVHSGTKSLLQLLIQPFTGKKLTINGKKLELS